MQTKEEEIMANRGQPSKGSKGYIPITIAAGALVILTLYVAVFLPPSTVQAANSSGMLALTSASAVGIERILEVFWAAVGLTGRPWWPFTLIGHQVQDLVKNLNTTLEPLQARAQDVSGDVGNAAGRMAEEFPNLQQVNRLTENLDKITPNNPQARESLLLLNEVQSGLRHMRAISKTQPPRSRPLPKH